MKRKLMTVLSLMLAVLLLGATGTIGIPFVTAAEDKTFNTSDPVYLYDFTTEAIQSTFTSTTNLEVSMGDGYTTFTAVTDDPYTCLEIPACSPSQAKYAAIAYRTTAPGGGLLVCTRSDAFMIGFPGTIQSLTWNPSGEWETAVVSMDAWKDAPDDATFTLFRIDPLDGNVAVGDSIDMKYVAFFSTEEEARGFDYDEYMAKLAWEEEQKRAEEEASKEVDWPDPTYKDMETTDEDTHEGTLKYTPSEDGKTVTVSYEVNGERLSYTVPNDHNYLYGGYAGTDDLNRPLFDSSEVGSYKDGERYIGLFYFLWHGEHGDSGVFDLQKIIDEVGIEAAGNVSCGKYGPAGAMHWFSEPLYGYYYANDAWVMRKHAELLTMANIDFLFFDVTNAFPYTHNALQLMEILHELNEQGFDAPQVVFYTNGNAHNTVKAVYEAIYKPGKFPDTWFMLDGKPVIVAPYDANVDDFFTVKQNQWPNEEAKENGWPCLDFEWPQRVFKDENGNPHAINVSVAQHSGTVCFTHSSLYNNCNNRGRSFVNPDGIPSSNSKIGRTLRLAYEAWKKDPSLTNYGLNFQAQWDHALSTDAPIILVTGWNEWVAQRIDTEDGWIYFVDTASMEFSRDTEMMRGGYFDNYYMQLMYNVQRAKGTAPVIVQDSRKPINVTGEFDQWNDITVTYTDPTGDTADRDAIGFGRTPYTNTSGRNDIKAAKVTSDSKNLYFYVQTVNDISMYDAESSWMQFYVNVDRRDAESGETGWYGYDFIINHKAKDAFTTTVAKYNGEGGVFSFETVGEVSYRVKDNEMMIAVPLSMLGIEEYREINVEFKIADSDTVYDEMEDFYCDGDAAPLGRLNFVYQNYIPGASQNTPTEEPTEEPTEAPTEPETEVDTDTRTETTIETSHEEPTKAHTDITDSTDTSGAATSNSNTDDPNGGCKSALSGGAIVLILLCGIVVVPLRKSKE